MNDVQDVRFSSIISTKARKYIFLPLLMLLMISSLVLSVLSLKSLQWEDKISFGTGFMLFLYGLIFYTAAYETSNHLFLYTGTGKTLINKYKLSEGFVKEISNKNISTIQALFCCITGLTASCYSCTRDMLHTSHYISEAYAWFGAAYFLYDIWSMHRVNVAVKQDAIQSNAETHFANNGTTIEHIDNHNNKSTFFHFVKENPIIVGHHVFVGGFGFLVMTYFRGDLGDCFFGFIFLMEASTPFVSFRSIISKVGYKRSKFYVVNGVLMMATFFVFRVIMWPLVLLLYAYSVNMNYFEAIYSLPLGCKISILILMLPQLYWFGLIVKGATQINKKKND